MKWISKDDKANFINLMVLHGPLFYLSFGAVMGMTYAEEEGAGPLYKVYLALLFLLGLFPVLKMFLQNRCTSKIILPLLVVLVYILFAKIQLSSDEGSFLLQLVCFGIPAVCVALSMDKEQGLAGMMKWFDLFLPLLAFSFIFLIRNLMVIKMMGVAAYNQNTSYFAAYCFVIESFLIRYKDYYPKFQLTDKKWYRIVRFLLLPYFFVICIFAGGRGAVILLFVSIIYNLGALKKMPGKKIWKIVCVVFFLLIALTISVSNISDNYNEILIGNYERVTALFEGGKVDVSASSGRNNIYGDAITAWGGSPIFGYGLFSYLDHFYIRPHNVILEIMLQGGLVLLTIFFYFLFRAIMKYRKMIRRDRWQILLMPFILYSSTQLMFSGSYWMETFFWFIFTYIYAYNFKKVKIVEATD